MPVVLRTGCIFVGKLHTLPYVMSSLTGPAISDVDSYKETEQPFDRNFPTKLRHRNSFLLSILVQNVDWHSIHP